MIGISLGIGHLAGIAVFLAGVFWYLMKVIVRQFNEALTKRFEQLEEARKTHNTETAEQFKKIEDAQKALDKELEDAQKALAKELGSIKLELAKEYWRREDAVRNESVTQAKLDGLARRLDEFLNRKP
jgi:uncharacterized protein HemX